jgi:hypothetical protein
MNMQPNAGLSNDTSHNKLSNSPPDIVYSLFIIPYNITEIM